MATNIETTQNQDATTNYGRDRAYKNAASSMSNPASNTDHAAATAKQENTSGDVVPGLSVNSDSSSTVAAKPKAVQSSPPTAKQEVTTGDIVPGLTVTDSSSPAAAKLAVVQSSPTPAAADGSRDNTKIALDPGLRFSSDWLDSAHARQRDTSRDTARGSSASTDSSSATAAKAKAEQNSPTPSAADGTPDRTKIALDPGLRFSSDWLDSAGTAKQEVTGSSVVDSLSVSTDASSAAAAKQDREQPDDNVMASADTRATGAASRADTTTTAATPDTAPAATTVTTVTTADITPLVATAAGNSVATDTSDDALANVDVMGNPVTPGAPDSTSQLTAIQQQIAGATVQIESSLGTCTAFGIKLPNGTNALVTDAHCLPSAGGTVTATYANGDTADVKVLGSNDSTDLAILSFPDIPGLQTLPLASPGATLAAPNSGQQLSSDGYPNGVGPVPISVNYDSYGLVYNANGTEIPMIQTTPLPPPANNFAPGASGAAVMAEPPPPSVLIAPPGGTPGVVGVAEGGNLSTGRVAITPIEYLGPLINAVVNSPTPTADAGANAATASGPTETAPAVYEATAKTAPASADAAAEPATAPAEKATVAPASPDAQTDTGKVPNASTDPSADAVAASSASGTDLSSWLDIGSSGDGLNFDSVDGLTFDFGDIWPD